MRSVRCNTCEDYFIVQIMRGWEQLIGALGFELIITSFSQGFGHVYALLCRLQVCRHWLPRNGSFCAVGFQMHTASVQAAWSTSVPSSSTVFVKRVHLCKGSLNSPTIPISFTVSYIHYNGKSDSSFHIRAWEIHWGNLERTRLHTTCRCPTQLRQSCKPQYHHNYHQNISVDPHNLGCSHTHLCKTPPLSLHGIWWLYILIPFLVQAEVLWRYHRYFYSSMGRSSPILGT